jgi:hypothetical protein
LLGVVAVEAVPPAIRDCACDQMAGVNPKPPSAVAARGLTPAIRSKQGLEIELGMGVSVACKRVVVHHVQ